jgi:hypothetical protein
VALTDSFIGFVALSEEARIGFAPIIPTALQNAKKLDRHRKFISIVRKNDLGS